MTKYQAFTDGAATMRKINGEYVREAGGWAYLILHDNEQITQSYGGEPSTSNNAMELTAILNALQFFDNLNLQGAEFEISSDSAYCINIFTQWIKGWKANAWTRGKKHEPIENLGIIKEIDRLIEKQKANFNKVSFVKVKGHSGDKYNEIVDQLAVKGKLEVSPR